jgi:hypothetical protein
MALLPAVGVWDAANLWLDPHESFTREPQLRDHRPLRAQAVEMATDLRRRFLAERGSLLMISTPPLEISDSCLWQGVYTAVATLNNVLEPSPANRRQAERAFDGLALLATKGRPLVRFMMPADIPVEETGLWYHRDARWQWKEDASIDSASGWAFGCVVALRFLPSRRTEARALLTRFADALIDGGYRLRNSDGSPTRFSAMGGSLVNSPPGVLVTLAALKALSRENPDSRYGRAYARFLAQGQNLLAARAASAPVPWLSKTTNHNIAYLALAAASLTEDDPERWQVYARGLLRLESLTDKTGNSFWIDLTAWTLEQGGTLQRGLAADPVYRRYREPSPQRLRLAKTSMLEWHYPFSKQIRVVMNSPRIDVPFVHWPLGRRFPAQPLPIYLRPASDFVWQRSPGDLDNWPGRHGERSFAPLDFLAAYTFGRLSGALSAAE